MDRIIKIDFIRIILQVFYFDEVIKLLLLKVLTKFRSLPLCLKIIMSTEQSPQNLSRSIKSNEEESVLFLIPFI